MPSYDVDAMTSVSFWKRFEMPTFRRSSADSEIGRQGRMIQEEKVLKHFKWVDKVFERGCFGLKSRINGFPISLVINRYILTLLSDSIIGFGLKFP